MVKYFCDRCGKEAKNLVQIQVPKEKHDKYGGFNVEPIHVVCSNCKREFDNIISKLTDIRFILFNDFIKKK